MGSLKTKKTIRYLSLWISPLMLLISLKHSKCWTDIYYVKLKIEKENSCLFNFSYFLSRR